MTEAEKRVERGFATACAAMNAWRNYAGRPIADDEVEGSIFIYNVLRNALGSVIFEPGEVAFEPPDLLRDAAHVEKAARDSFARRGVDADDGDVLAALLSAALHVMRPALLKAVERRIAEENAAS